MIERDVRGIPLWLIREYMEELGGVVRDEHHVEGDGWRAELEQIEDFQIGSLKVGQVMVRLYGDDLDAINAQLDDKLIRAGG
ncbi:MAG: DUF1952 domain-containing protein [Planctomycetota bacterium]